MTTDLDASYAAQRAALTEAAHAEHASLAREYLDAIAAADTKYLPKIAAANASLTIKLGELGAQYLAASVSARTRKTAPQHDINDAHLREVTSTTEQYFAEHAEQVAAYLDAIAQADAEYLPKIAAVHAKLLADLRTLDVGYLARRTVLQNS